MKQFARRCTYWQSGRRGIVNEGEPCCILNCCDSLRLFMSVSFKEILGWASDGQQNLGTSNIEKPSRSLQIRVGRSLCIARLNGFRDVSRLLHSRVKTCGVPLPNNQISSVVFGFQRAKCPCTKSRDNH